MSISSVSTARRRLLRLSDVLAKTGKKRTSLLTDVNAGRFPRPIKIGARAVAWVDCEVEAWISARMVDRGDA